MVTFDIFRSAERALRNSSERNACCAQSSHLNAFFASGILSGAPLWICAMMIAYTPSRVGGSCPSANRISSSNCMDGSQRVCMEALTHRKLVEHTVR